MIKNITRKKIICSRKKTLTSVFGKATGLMFAKQIKDIGYVFVFDTPRRIDLHMFFVFFPIDLLFLDEEKRVIEMKESFMPFTIFYSRKKASFVIEIPEGTIKITKTKIGDKLNF